MAVPSAPAQTFVFITLAQMQAFLQRLSPRFVEIKWPGSRERVFSLPLRHHPAVLLLVFSSIEGQYSRELGKDALRITLFDTQSQRFLGGKTATKRIVGWEGRLAGKIRMLGAKISSYVCPMRCGGYLTERKATAPKGAAKLFLGCTNYPRCRYTQRVESPALAAG